MAVEKINLIYDNLHLGRLSSKGKLYSKNIGVSGSFYKNNALFKYDNASLTDEESKEFLSLIEKIAARIEGEK
jgi:hypothetical protein